MQITIISGDNVTILEIAPDMELENFLALCQVEMPQIANTPFEQLMLNFNGRKISPNQTNLKKQLQVSKNHI